MSPMAIGLLATAVIMGLIVLREGLGAEWHWAGCILAALVPVDFTYFLGWIGLIISGAFMTAVLKATS